MASKKKPLLRRMFHKKNVQRYIILPTSLLLLNIVEEVFCYKAEVIQNPYARSGALMVMFLCGFGLVGLVLAPLITKSLERMYFGGRNKGGYAGEMLILLILYAGLYYVYYLLYGTPGGVESLLPGAWRNGFM